MNREHWIENRVLWRLKSLLPVNDVALTGDSIPADIIHQIAADCAPMLMGKPLIAFRESPQKWTVLTTELVASRHSSVIHSVNVGCGFQVDISLLNTSDIDLMNVKSTLQFLSLMSSDGSRTEIWAPQGAPCFALWSILRMFPFK
jgi:hypothetical protein